MRWKKVTDTNDLLVYEKVKKELNIRIEARSTEDGWEVFKNYNDGKQSGFVEEYFTDSKVDALEHIKLLIAEKDLSSKELQKIKKLRTQKIDMQLYRIYKERNIEKWSCSINGDSNAGFVVVRFNENIEVDVVLKEKHRFVEEQIMDDIIKILGLSEFSKTIEQDIYYYSRHSNFATEHNDKLFVGKLECDFDSNI